jgi:hypothetical protein
VSTLNGYQAMQHGQCRCSYSYYSELRLPWHLRTTRTIDPSPRWRNTSRNDFIIRQDKYLSNDRKPHCASTSHQSGEHQEGFPK